MAIVRLGEIFDKAIKEGYAVGAFNIFNMESIEAVLKAAEIERSATIIQVSMGARKYTDIGLLIQLIKIMAKDSPIPICIQHDHCSDLEICKNSIELGVMSVMIDGSHFPYEENIALTKSVVKYAHARGVWVEAELGSLPGREDDVSSETCIYTKPDEAIEFVKRTGCDSLAIAIGTSHGGVNADKDLELSFPILEELVEKMPGYPIVLHGGASLPTKLVDVMNKYGGTVKYLRNASDESISKACKMGVCKVNIDVDNFYACTAALRKYFVEHSDVYDPKKYGAIGREAFMKMVQYKMKNVLFSSGRY